jgi:peptidoglycan/xylan/chitin deacetylase (PgdA/CDA1 family)
VVIKTRGRRLPLIRSLKQTLLRTLSLPGATIPFHPFVRGRATVFMLHRFPADESDAGGHDVNELRRTLEYLRKHRYELVGLEELVLRLRGEGAPPNRSVVFTIDDGYLSHATVACPLFAEFDCPVTTFVTTGFLDGYTWLWWDQIEFIFSGAGRVEIVVQLARTPLVYRCSTAEERRIAIGDFTSRCKLVSDEERRAAIVALAEAAGIQLPADPPARYAPMSWEQLRCCETHGMRFGPHTVTHPTLSRTSDEQSRRELVESWQRLQSEAAHPVRVFCYPNGQSDDFGEREVTTLRELGFAGAVSAMNGYADAGRVQSEPAGAFRIRRFGYPDSLPHVIQIVSGFERVKEILRGKD